MRRRHVVRAGAGALICAALLAPNAGAAAKPAADESLRGYQGVVDSDAFARLGDFGIDAGETGYDRAQRGDQTVYLRLYPSQAAEIEAAGIDLTGAPAYTVAPVRAPRTTARGADRSKPETGGDSPNAFYDVFRTYSEPGGIADELRALAARYPDDSKLVRIGTSTRGKPILALKVTRNARNTPDGQRPAMFYSGVNHAREWIAAETARRLPTWFLEHKDEGRTKDVVDRSELWFLPIMNPDGYDYTFTCGQGDGLPTNVPCGAETDPATGRVRYVDAGNLVQTQNNRLWRKTLRDNNNDGVFGNGGDGTDPNRNYPTAWNLDEEGASNNPASEVYRGPYPLSEPENLAYDRLLRKITPEAVVNYHSAAQLLLYPFGFITDVSSDDNPWFVALTGTDGDAAVDPYISQRSSDLYITNGETTDHAYNKYQSMSWTPELDECLTGGGGTACVQADGRLSGFTFPDDESKVEAVFQKNLDFARNVAQTVTDRDRPDRPVQANEDASSYQVKPAVDIEANAFGVSYGGVQPIEANVRRILGAADVELNVTGPGGPARRLTLRMQDQRGGERFGDLRGKYYRKVAATPPASFIDPGVTPATGPCPPLTTSPYPPGCPRALVAGDVVRVIVRAGGQRQQFSYRVQSTRPAGATKRVLVVAAEDYKGVSPNKSAYASAPRYADEYATALAASGAVVETFDVDSPPNGPAGAPVSKFLSKLGTLNHFDAVVYETGDDLVPQDTTETVTDSTFLRATGRATSQGSQVQVFTGSGHVARYGPRNWQAVRDYLNEGGKVIYAGRNLWTPQTGTSIGSQAYANYVQNSPLAFADFGWWQEPAFGFDYPPNQAGDDDRPGSAFFRELAISNDFGAYFLGVAARQGGPFTDQVDTAAAAPVGTGGLFAGLPPVTIDSTVGAGATLDPTQDPSGASTPVAKTPLRLRSYTSLNLTSQRAIRQERVELDYTGQNQTNPGPDGTTIQNGGGAAISTRDSVTFGFGLEQVGAAARQELLSRSLEHLVPSTPDTTAPTATFLRPAADSEVSPRDPIELEVDAADDSGDLKEVRFRKGGVVFQTKVSFPFQGRYTPTAAEVGQPLQITADVEDAAGNVTTVTRTFRVISAAAAVDSPLATGTPSLTGQSQVGSVLTCASPGFANGPASTTYAFLRNGVAIPGATASTYTVTPEDLGRQISCRVTGTNSAGSGDATSEARTISAAQGPKGDQGPTGPAGADGRDGQDGASGAPGRDGVDGANGAQGPAGPVGPQGPFGPIGPVGPQGPKGDKGDPGTFPRLQVECEISRNRKAIECTITELRSTPRAATRNVRGSMRLQGRSATVTRTRKGSVKLTATSRTALKRSTRAVVTVTLAGKRSRVVVPVGKAVRVR